MRPAVILAFLLSGLPFSLADEAFTLHTTSDSIPAATLSSADNDGELTFQAAASAYPIQVDCNQLVSWGAWQPAFLQSTVWTAGGSWIAGNVTFNQNRLTVKPAWAAGVEIPLSQLGGLLLHAPANPNQRRELIGEMLSSEGSRDLVWLTSGQKVSGLLQIEQSASGTQFLLSNGSQSVSMAAKEIRAIVFSPELAAPPKLVDLPQAVGLGDGSLICVRDLGPTLTGLARDRSASLESAGGIRFETSQKSLIGQINFLTSSPTGCIRLSQAEPASYKYSSESLVDWPLGKNKDVRGGLLTAGRGIQPRGIAMHATSQAAFRISEDCQQFIAEVTLSGVPAAESSSRSPSPTQRELGSVTCEVLVARNGKLQQLAEVQLSSANQRRAQIRVDCQGSRLVVLVVREADKGNYGDQVYWNEARLIR